MGTPDSFYVAASRLLRHERRREASRALNH